jgi:2-keto-4-pentenoate hydratase
MTEEVDPRVVAALQPLFERWRAELDAGAQRVGWKIGLNIPEVQQSFGLREPVIGYLTSATQVEHGGTYTPEPGAELRAEAEIALYIDRDVPADADAATARGAIAGLAASIELVDVARPPGELEGILLGNVFHRGFVLGPRGPILPTEFSEAHLHIDELSVAASVPGDFADVVMVVARLLGALGEGLQAGDWIISGAVVHLPVAPGNRVVVDVDRLEPASVTIAE